MIGTETDMSYIVAVANVVVIVVLIPTLMNKRSFIPHSTSIPTSVALLMFTFVFFNQGHKKEVALSHYLEISFDKEDLGSIAGEVEGYAVLE